MELNAVCSVAPRRAFEDGGGMKRKMLRGELVLSTWEDLTLTTHRVWQLTRKSGGTVELTTFSLEDVSWVRFGRSHLPTLLWLAAAAALGGVAVLDHDQIITYGLFAGSLLLMVLYATTRRLVVVVAANGREVAAQSDGDTAHVEGAMQFIDELERRKMVVRVAKETASVSSSGWRAVEGR